MIEIDGSQGEGGGQLLRTALSVAALTGRAVRIVNIRAGRSTPGLAPQHLTVVRALAAVCSAELEGAELRSSEVSFAPTAPPKADEYRFDVADAAANGSAGSVTLLAQALIPVLALAPGGSRLELLGGTHVRWSPSFEYFEGVYLPRLDQLGMEVECELAAPGFYPVGGGHLVLQIRGGGQARLRPLRIEERGDLRSVRGAAVASNLPSHIPQRMTDRSRNLLSDLDVPFRVTPRRLTGQGPGAALTLLAEYEGGTAGFTAYGERGKPSETVAEEACQALLQHHASGAPVDAHLADQLLLPLSLVPDMSTYVTVRSTGHLATSAHLLEELSHGDVRLGDRPDDTVDVRVQGARLSE